MTPLSQGELEARLATKTAPRITRESIAGKVVEVEYILRGTLTLALVKMRNGFTVIGKAAPASPENYDPEIGQTYAWEDAIRQLFQLEGYALCERLRGDA